MFPFFNPKAFESLAGGQAAPVARLMECQRKSVAALGKIIENGNRAFLDLASARDPQAVLAITEAVMRENTAILTQLGESLMEGFDAAATPAAADAEASPTKRKGPAKKT
jgi:hypothetical protein